MTLTATTIRKLRALNLSDDVFDKVLEIIEDAKTKPPKKGDTADRSTRGTRLPSNWVLPRSWGEYALAQGLRDHEVRREADNFKDYWLGLAGAKGIKLDWEATWRGWVRRTAERLGRAPILVPSAPAAADPATFSHETWQAIVRAWRRTDQWKPEHGPAPGTKGCLCPIILLSPACKTLFDTPDQPCHT